MTKEREEEIRQWALKVLGRMPSFRTDVSPPKAISDPVGVYEAHSGDGPVWVTPSAIFVAAGDEWLKCSYADMERIRAPSSKDRGDPASGEIRIVLRNGGDEILVPVRGGGERTCDSFEFLRFLDRVSSIAKYGDIHFWKHE